MLETLQTGNCDLTDWDSVLGRHSIRNETTLAVACTATAVKHIQSIQYEYLGPSDEEFKAFMLVDYQHIIICF